MSLTIIDNTVEFSPKYVYQKPPDFYLFNKPELEIRKYYDLQVQIWEEGYYRGGEKVLSGKHYWYLQEIWLKTGLGDIIRPYWKDVDELVWNTIDECIDNDNEDLLVLKRREIGLTSMFIALSFWFARMFPGSTLNLTSADKKRFVRMFEDKIIVAYNRMSPYIMNCKPKNINRTRNDVYLKIEMKKRLEDGKEEIRETEFNLIETSQSDDSVANFSASRTPLMIVDEIFLHARIIELIRSSKATLMQGTKKIGFFIGGGTCEHTVSQEQLKKYKILWDEAKMRGIRTLFLPAWMGLKECSVNGWSDEKKGTEWVLKQIEAAERTSDPNDVIAQRKNYPLSLDDIWKLSEGDGAFEKDVMDMLEHRLTELEDLGLNEESAVKLINVAGEVTSVHDKKPRGKNDGGFWMIEPPQDGQQYYQTIDGAASGKEDGAEQGSWFATIIWKGISLNGDHYCPVNIYFERPNRLEDGYRNSVTQYRFYNKFNGMVNTNYETAGGLGGNYGSYLDAEGLFKTIMRRKDLTAKGNIDVNKLGTAVDENVLDSLYRRGNIFLRRHAHKFRSRMVLSSLMLPRDVNADLRSSFLIFMASIAGWDKPKKIQQVQQFREVVRLVRDAQGYYKQTVVKIPKSNASIHPQHLSEITIFQNELIKKYGEAYWYNKATGEEKQRYIDLKNVGEAAPPSK